MIVPAALQKMKIELRSFGCLDVWDTGNIPRDTFQDLDTFSEKPSKRGDRFTFLFYDATVCAVLTVIS